MSEFKPIARTLAVVAVASMLVLAAPSAMAHDPSGPAPSASPSPSA